MFKLLARLPILLLATIATAQIPSEFTTGFNKSSVTLTMSFDGQEVTTGDLIPLTETTTAPTFSLGLGSTNSITTTYLIVGIDVDAPSRANPTLAQVLHFMNTDFTMATGSDKKLASTNAVATEPYMAPAPPPGSGPHRYIFLMFEQPSGFTPEDLPITRTGFDLESWRKENGLSAAVAGTYFETELSGSSNSSASETGAASPTSGEVPSTTGMGGSAAGNMTGGGTGTNWTAPNATASLFPGAASGLELEMRGLWTCLLLVVGVTVGGLL